MTTDEPGWHFNFLQGLSTHMLSQQAAQAVLKAIVKRYSSNTLIWGPSINSHESFDRQIAPRVRSSLNLRLSSSSTRWKSRQGRDAFTREAKVQGLKSRAAFKLLEVRTLYTHIVLLTWYRLMRNIKSSRRARPSLIL